jgi:hypothetical protein
MPKHKGVYDTVFSGENNTIVGVDNKNAILSKEKARIVDALSKAFRK